jgi:hypothetical protein
MCVFLTEYITGQIMRQGFYESFQTFAKDMLKSCDSDTTKAELAFRVICKYFVFIKTIKS